MSNVNNDAVSLLLIV